MGLLLLLLAVALLAVDGQARRLVPSLELRSSGSITCDLCKAFALLIEAGFAANITETALLHQASLLCSRLLPHFSQAMCDGIIQERYGKVVYAIAKKLDGKLTNVGFFFLYFLFFAFFFLSSQGLYLYWSVHRQRSALCEEASCASCAVAAASRKQRGGQIFCAAQRRAFRPVLHGGLVASMQLHHVLVN